MIRVLIVDDSSVVRRILREALASDPELEMAGVASDGESALIRIEQTQPDIVTLDVEMPGISGLATLREIRKRWPRLPVIMFSMLTEKGALTTLDALSLGASDYVAKPGNSNGLEETRQRICSELIPKLKGLTLTVQAARIEPRRPKDQFDKASPAKDMSSQPKIDIVAIGASTGGPNALGQLLPQLPGDLGLPIVVVQHMPALFTKYLADRLAKFCALKVAEGQAGREICPNEVWIAPGDSHMTVERAGPRLRLRLNQEAPENSCRPAVDVLFRSVAENFGPNALGVVLTGMGSDGVRGSERIVAEGGKVIVQDAASSVVWGMPGQVAAAGYADGIYPLAEIAQEIERRVEESRRSLGWESPVRAGA